MNPGHVVVVPSTLALLPGYAGLEDPIAQLRAAAHRAVRWLVERHPDEVAVLAADVRADNMARGVVESSGRRIGRQLLVDAGFEGRHADRARGLLVVANGTACRSEKAPGHLDDRAFDYDRGIEEALGAGSPGMLRDLDVSLAQELWAYDVAALRELGQLVLGPVTAEVDHADDPYGVRYWVVRWTCGS